MNMLSVVRCAVISSTKSNHVARTIPKPWQQTRWESEHKILPNLPELNELDLEEKFISGSGPGGQNVNKAVNCCQLRHKPSGIVVKVHQMRSLEQNRKIARELLRQKLDNLYNGEESIQNQRKRLMLQKMATRKSQSEKRRLMKEQFKMMMGSDNDCDAKK